MHFMESETTMLETISVYSALPFIIETNMLFNATNISKSLQNPMGRSTDMYVTHEDLETIKFTFGIILIPTFSLFGSIGNILSLVVLVQHRMRNPTNFLLAALTVSDLLFLLHCLLFSAINIHIHLDPFVGKNIRNTMFPVFGAYGSLVTARITSWLTALLSIERFIAVYFPMKAKRICNKKFTVIAIFLIYLIPVILFIPYALKYKVIEKTNRNRTYAVLYKSDLGANEKFYDIYGITMNILFRFIPIALLLILNTLIMRVITKTWTRRRSMSNAGSSPQSAGEQIHITIMLMTVTFLFAVCILPGAINSVISHIWEEYTRFGEARNLLECVSYITYFLENLNSSINFVIYMALSKRFCVTYKEIFCCERLQHRSGFSNGSYNSAIKERTRNITPKHHKQMSHTSIGSYDSKYSTVHRSEHQSSLHNKRSMNGLVHSPNQNTQTEHEMEVIFV